MNIALIYFSATGNTAKIANTLIETLETYEGVNIDSFDITSLSTRLNKLDLDKYEGIFFGFPIYVLRAPRIIVEWLNSFDDGKRKKISTFFTYGGVIVGLAHHDMKNLLEEKNFRVVSSGEFLGAHTYNLAGFKSMVGHPNQDDLDIAKEYAEKTYKRFIGEDKGLLELPPAKYTEEFVNRMRSAEHRMVKIEHPSRRGATCSMCRTCEEECPTGAMDAESGEVDTRKCVACLKCLANCPDKALKFPDIAKRHEMAKKMFKITSEMIQNRKSKYYT